MSRTDLLVEGQVSELYDTQLYIRPSRLEPSQKAGFIQQDAGTGCPLHIGHHHGVTGSWFYGVQRHITQQQVHVGGNDMTRAAWHSPGRVVEAGARWHGKYSMVEAPRLALPMTTIQHRVLGHGVPGC